ncbi:MAG: 5'-3' exonuclease H3TH domain-containing protein [Vigna little leaf phytoplasma]|nr:5'-3' exonuclease H3TH domain-containing protein [Vigna little leaf phytoplasma]
MKRLVLVDGNSLVFRAYYATAYKQTILMQNQQKEDINALIVFMKMFQKILQYTDEYICVVFDSPQKTKKHHLYEDYKKGRAITPFSLIKQIQLIKTYLELSGIFYYVQPGYEADDIIGTIAKKASYQKAQVLIFSSDKDFLQLIDKHITFYFLKKGMTEIISYDEITLWKEYNLKAKQITHFKSLIGDNSDNIPGVPSIGPKTAIKLLHQFQNLDNIFQNLTQIREKTRIQLINYQQQVFKNLKLVTIDQLIPLGFEYIQMKRRKIDSQLLIAFLKHNKLKKW